MKNKDLNGIGDIFKKGSAKGGQEKPGKPNIDKTFVAKPPAPKPKK